MSTVAAIESPQSLVHVAILRKARKRREAQVEAKLTAFFEEAAQQRGVCGADLIRPVSGSYAHEYGVLRTFQSEADMHEFRPWLQPPIR
jgi:hypothetical protein